MERHWISCGIHFPRLELQGEVRAKETQAEEDLTGEHQVQAKEAQTGEGQAEKGQSGEDRVEKDQAGEREADAILVTLTRTSYRYRSGIAREWKRSRPSAGCR